MWILRQIREDLERISPRCLERLNSIGGLPHEEAVKIAAYLWEGCFQSSNDVWVAACGRLLHELPPRWLETHILEVLDQVQINWDDSFEFYNLCAAFYHMPDALARILSYAEGKIPPDSAGEWLSDMREMAGDRGHYEKVRRRFETLDKAELKGPAMDGSNERVLFKP